MAPSDLIDHAMRASGLGPSMPQKDLPEDITQAQFVILKQFRAGISKPKVVAKNLSMDKKEVENQVGFLKSNGYLSDKSKLTTKAIELFSS